MRKDILWPAATGIAVALAMAAAYRWCDLGEALLEAGQKEKARYCFQQAQQLAPNLPRSG